MDSLRVLILAGGLGTRLRPAIGATPKAMAAIAGRPFLEHLLDRIALDGHPRVALLTGYGADVIEEYFGTGGDRDMEIAYSREPEPLGTGGALKLAASRFLDERFVVMNGDSLFQLRLDSLVDAHRRTGASATLALARASEPGRFGGVECDSDGRVRRFVEKGEAMAGGLVNAGIYVIERSVLTTIPSNRAVSLEREVFPALVGKGLYAFPFDGPLVDIGVPRDLDALRSQPEMALPNAGGDRG